MNKQINFSGVALLTVFILGSTMLFSGCKNKTVESNAGDSIAADSQKVAVTDSTMYGILGEGTGMSCVELITDKGDTLNLVKDNEETGQSAIMAGDVEYGNRYAFTMNKQHESLVTLLNLTQLCHAWVQPIPGQSGKQGFELQMDGQKASSINMATLTYTSWKIFNGKLILNSKSQGNGAAFDVSDTLTVQTLTDDSLIIRRGDMLDRYARRK
jgi:hypothetical protein